MPALMIAALACAAFVISHLVLAGTRLRDLAVARLSERGFMALYSLISLATFGWLVVAFGAARADPTNVRLWTAPASARWVQLALQLAAMTLVVGGLTTPSPTSVAQQAVLDRPEPVQGLIRITRHPFLWGVALWATGHLIVTGAPADIILFGGLLSLALLGTSSIDAKRRRALGERWTAFAGQTSNVPFAAIAAGTQSLRLQEIGWVRPAVALAVWAGLLVAHKTLFGASPIP